MDEIKKQKQKLSNLSDERSQMEVEMSQLLEYLHQPGFPGIHGGLVDKEGYPDSDLPIYEIRTARNRLAYLQTDYKSLNNRIEMLVHEIMELQEFTKPSSEIDQEALKNQSRIETISNNSHNLSKLESTRRQPSFGLIVKIFPDSPAFTAGLHVGDKIIQMGGLKITEAGQTSVDNIISKLPLEVENFLDLPMKILALRSGETIELSITPQKWKGIGYLGCHLVPIYSHS